MQGFTIKNKKRRIGCKKIGRLICYEKHYLTKEILNMEGSRLFKERMGIADGKIKLLKWE